jgi:L-2-hydroxyglutarate oxidase LhgO
MIISGFLVIGGGVVGLSTARELKKDILNLALLSWRKKQMRSSSQRQKQWRAPSRILLYFR